MARSEMYGDYSATSLLTIICTSLALYNSLELLLLIFTTFRRYHGLYFWSILIANFAIIPYAVGLIVFTYDKSATLAGLVINNVSWIVMVVAQSVVLYSRLGIVLGNPKARILVFMKWLIVVNAIICYTLATTSTFGERYTNSPRYKDLYRVTEKLQMTAFTLVEVLLSSIYLIRVVDILKAGEKKEVRRTLWQLFAINVIIVVLDLGLLILEYIGLTAEEIAFKTLVYSVKLKMEFAILNKLVESSSSTKRNMSGTIALDDDRKTSCVEHWTPHSDLASPETVHRGTGQQAYFTHTVARRGSRATSHSDTNLLGLSQISPTILAPSLSRESSESYHRMMKVISQPR